MAIVNQVEKRVRMSTWQVVKYQILTHCYLYDIPVSEADLNCLTLLAIEGDQELTSFCNKAFEKKIFSSTQSVRNCLTKAEKKNGSPVCLHRERLVISLAHCQQKELSRD